MSNFITTCAPEFRVNMDSETIQQPPTSYDELAGYIRTNVTQQSLVLNGKSQTPTVTASTTAADWQNWKMK